MAEKRYHWLKLKVGFFGEKEVKKLRKIAGGDTYTIIYLKLQLLSVENKGIIYFEGIEKTFEEEMALALDEEEENVNMTLMYLKKHGCLEMLSEEEYLLPKVIKNIGSESSSAERVRKLRDNKKALQCNNDVTKCNAIESRVEKEIDIEKEVEKKEKNNSTAATNLYTPEKAYQENIGLLTSHIAERIEKIISDGVSEELLIKYIQVATERNKRNWGYIEKMALGNLSDNIQTLEQYAAICVERKTPHKTTESCMYREVD